MFCIIQARMNSVRLPGKVMMEVDNKPLLLHTVLRIKKSKFVKRIIIATSNKPEDKKIINFCKKNKLDFIIGPEDKVSSRFNKIINKYKLDRFVRISGDSPLIDFRIIDKAILLSKIKDFDIITNTFYRTYPSGHSVELVNAQTYKKIIKNFKTKNHFEHVTSYFYENCLDFKIINFTSGIKLINKSQAIDKKRDLIRFKNFYKNYKNLSKWSEIDKKY